MRTHKKFPRCEICNRPVNINVAMSDAEGNKAHIYCVAKLNGLWRLTDEIQKNPNRTAQDKSKKVTAKKTHN